MYVHHTASRQHASYQNLAQVSYHDAIFEFQISLPPKNWKSRPNRNKTKNMTRSQGIAMIADRPYCFTADCLAIRPNECCQVASPVFSRYSALSVLVHKFDLSGSRDVISHVTS